MLKIKLARFGKKNQPHFRIVVNEARSKVDGQYVALLGHYSPISEPKVLTLDLKEYSKWIKKGALPTNTVANLAKKVESGNPFPEKPKKPSKKSMAKVAAEKEEKVVETEAPVVENEAEAEKEVATENAAEAGNIAESETTE